MTGLNPPKIQNMLNVIKNTLTERNLSILNSSKPINNLTSDPSSNLVENIEVTTNRKEVFGPVLFSK